MILGDIVEKLAFDVKAGEDLMNREVLGGYASDMLSDVLAHARKGDLWVTLQTHINIIPVASMKELSGIVIVNGRVPDRETLMKAEEEKVPVMITDRTAYQVVGMLCEIGIEG